MSDKDKENYDFQLFKYFSPRKVAGRFINYYLSHEKKETKQKDLESLAHNISIIGYPKIVKIYEYLQKEFKYNIALENYFLAHKLQMAKEFYRKNVIEKAPDAKDFQDYITHHNESDDKKLRK